MAADLARDIAKIIGRDLGEAYLQNTSGRRQTRRTAFIAAGSLGRAISSRAWPAALRAGTARV